MRSCVVYLTNRFLLICLPLLTACSSKKTEVAWEIDLPRIGSQSSPRTADLNLDGTLDIVIGAGENEYVATARGILAIDGQTGTLLWHHAAEDLVFGSASFQDVTDDGVPDVFIGGRSCTLMALDGSDGAMIWRYDPETFADDAILKFARHNFYSSALVPDQNKDGYDDLLTQNGGNPVIGPGIEEGRDPGVLLLFDSQTGAILAADTMPDGKESYMSPLSYTDDSTGEIKIVFGSGGETIGGSLFVAGIEDLIGQQLDRAKVLATGEGHGFIAPPVLADINGDRQLDIIAISHGSSIYAIDGNVYDILWKQQIVGTECSNSFAVGNFNGDEVPDFFTFVSKGTWPNNTGLLQILLDGSNGQIIFSDSLGCTGFSSPVVYDLNQDGLDEAIISINLFNCSEGFSGEIKNIEHRLMAINFATGASYVIEQKNQFKNIFSTPWIGDLDQDRYLDIIHCQYYHGSSYITSFIGMHMKRISTHIKMDGDVLWGGYMGSAGDGIYQASH